MAFQCPSLRMLALLYGELMRRKALTVGERKETAGGGSGEAVFVEGTSSSRPDTRLGIVDVFEDDMCSAGEERESTLKIICRRHE